MKFKKEELEDIVWEGDIVSERIMDHTRWSVHYEIVFKHTDGKFYRTNYSKGATESQDERPFQYDDDIIEVEEVHQVEKLVKVWEKV